MISGNVPTNKDRYKLAGRCCGIILYNPEDGQGAVEEAYGLQEGFLAAGFDVERHTWTSEASLSGSYKTAINKSIHCSALLVCIMAHGTANYLHTWDNNHIQIADVIGDIAKQILPEKPLVRHSQITIPPWF